MSPQLKSAVFLSLPVCSFVLTLQVMHIYYRTLKNNKLYTEKIITESNSVNPLMHFHSSLLVHFEM